MAQQQRAYLNQSATLVDNDWYEDELGNSIRIFDETDGLELGTFRVVDTAIGFESEPMLSRSQARKELREYIKNNFIKRNMKDGTIEFPNNQI